MVKPLVTCSASKLRVQELVSDTSLAVLSFKCYSLVSIRNHPVFVCFLSINDYSDDFFSPMSHTSVISDEFVEIHTTLQLWIIPIVIFSLSLMVHTRQPLTNPPWLWCTPASVSVSILSIIPVVIFFYLTDGSYKTTSDETSMAVMHTSLSFSFNFLAS